MKSLKRSKGDVMVKKGISFDEITNCICRQR